MIEKVSKISFAVLIGLLLAPTILWADGGLISDTKIRFSKNKSSIYHFFRQISEQTKYTFIYDSNLIDNNKVVKISKKENTVYNAIQEIVDSRNIEIKVVDSYIILLSKSQEQKRLTQPSKDGYTTLQGTIINSEDRKGIAYCSIGILNSTIGTVTNGEGEFKIILPDSLLDKKIIISRIGYIKKEIQASLCTDMEMEFHLTPYSYSLSEAVINIIDPYKLLDNMQMNLKNNYAKEPVYITGFYREGIDYKQKHTDLTESILKIYKSGYSDKYENDQAKILKMRRVRDSSISDSIRTIVKIQSGVSTCFILDIAKHSPDFLEIYPRDKNPYKYRYIGISNIEGRKVYVIYFEQEKSITTPLYTGELYIDSEDFALVEAKFQINPKYIKDATSLYIVKRHRNLDIQLKKVEYIVSYKKAVDERYYINYIRGNLDFNLKNKKWIFNTNTPIGVWFDLINCQIDTKNIVRFNKEDRISPYEIFSENQHIYHPHFWEQFNTLLPEKELRKLIQSNLNEISTSSED